MDSGNAEDAEGGLYPAKAGQSSRTNPGTSLGHSTGSIADVDPRAQALTMLAAF